MVKMSHLTMVRILTRGLPLASAEMNIASGKSLKPDTSSERTLYSLVLKRQGKRILTIR